MPQRFGGPTKARPARPRLRGAACRRSQRLLGRDRLRSVGSVRSQANEARRHAGGRTSGNGPDTAGRAPLDARGWVPSVFRARPAHRNVSWNVSCSRLPLAFVFVLFLILFGKGQRVKVGRRPAGGASRQLRQPQGEGRAQRVPGYFSRGQLSFPGQHGRRSTLRAARGARGG